MPPGSVGGGVLGYAIAWQGDPQMGRASGLEWSIEWRKGTKGGLWS